AAKGIRYGLPESDECRGLQNPYHWHRRLLRPRRQRPYRRPAKPRDEFPPSHSITSSARNRNDSGIVRPIAFAAMRLMTNSILDHCSTGISAGLVPRKTLSTISAERRNMSGKLTPKDIVAPASGQLRLAQIVG